MVDAFAAISLADTIISFTELAIKTVLLIKRYSNEAHAAATTPGLPDGPLKQISVQLPVLVDALKIVREKNEKGKIQDAEAANIRGLITGCVAQLTQLQELLNKVLGAPNAAKKAFYTLKNEGKVEALRQSLQSFISILILHRVVHLPDVVETPKQAVTFFEVPMRRNADFVPRQDIAHNIDEYFKAAAMGQRTSPLTMVLKGPKRVGKTQIALEYCYQAREATFKSVFWVDGSSRDNVLARFASIASCFRQSKVVSNDPMKEVEFVKAFLTNWWHPWLMVLDDCSANVLRHMSDFVPDARCAILCTTRNDVPLSGAESISIRAFLSDEELRKVNKQLSEACSDNDVARVKAALKQGVDQNSGDYLRQAAWLRERDVVKVLLEAGANTSNQTKYNAVYAAAQGGDIATLKLMLDHQGKFDRAGEENSNNSALEVALKGGGRENTGADDKNQVVRTLLSHPQGRINFHKFNRSPLYWAIEGNNLEGVKLLLDHGIEPDHDDKYSSDATPLGDAVQREYTDIVQLLLDRGADPLKTTTGSNSFSAVAYAANRERLDYLELFATKTDISDGLSELAAVVDWVNIGPLHYAAIRNNIPLADFLIKHGAPLGLQDDNGRTALIHAVAYGQERMLEFLLAQPGILLDSPDSEGQTALHTAVDKGDAKVVSILLKSKPDVNRPDDEGRTPLLHAISKNDSRIARLLLRFGATTKPVNPSNPCPLLVAAKEGKDKIVSLLLQHDPECINFRNDDGDTALTLAAQEGHVEVVKELLKCVALEDIQNDIGETAMDLAHDGGHVEITRLLEQWKASKA